MISLFKGYHDTVPMATTLGEVVRLIREDATVKEQTGKFRYFNSLASPDKRECERVKSGTPCFAVAVRFDGGKHERHIAAWTGLTLADLDHLPPERVEELKALAAQDPHTLLAYVTISGCGLRILSRVTLPDDAIHDVKQMKRLYLAAFQQMNNHYARLLGFATDGQCKNCTRLSGLAHDDTLFFNPDATAFSEVKCPTARELAQQRRLAKARPAIEHELQAQGFNYAEGERNNYIMRTGYLMNAYGIDEAVATTWAVEHFSDYDGDVAAIFRACYAQSDEHGTRPLPGKSRAEGEAPAWATVSEVEQFIDSQCALRYNTVRSQVEIAWKEIQVDNIRVTSELGAKFKVQGSMGYSLSVDKGEVNPSTEFLPLTDRDENTLWCRMCKTGRRVRLPDVRNVIHSEHIPLYNPFIEYFQSLPPWDGVDYMAQVAQMIHTSGDHTLFTGHLRKWLVAMVASLLHEEVVNHEILVFIGRQGNYKTTFFNYLLPPQLQDYFYTRTNNNRQTKDDLLTLSEFAIICLEEIDELRPSELNQLKAMVTLKTVNERASYGRNKERRPHIASFCGTGNNPRFLTDPTGNRRWIAVEVLEIDDPHTHAIPYDGLYSQALVLLNQGFRYWFDPHETELLNRQNEAFEASNLEEELIRTHFRRPASGERGIFATTAHILASINYGLREPLSPTRVGLVMKKLGYESVRHNGARGYRVVELTGDEIYNQRRLIARETLGQEGVTP